jgi:hypothetical protein
MGTTTNVRMTVAVMLVWAGQFPIGLLAGAVDRWSPAIGGAIETASVVLFLPVAIIAAAWVVRRRPRWPSLDADRLAALLDAGERPIAVMAVRIAGTQPWRPGLLFAVVGEGALLGLLALSGSALTLVFLPMALLIVPGMLLVVGMSNRVAERSARRGRRRSTARSVPRSGGRPPNWLVLTDRRLTLVESGRGGRTGLVWHVPRSEFERATDARRSLRTLDRTIRLHFTDGSSVRMTAPDARPFLAASG